MEGTGGLEEDTSLPEGLTGGRHGVPCGGEPSLAPLPGEQPPQSPESKLKRDNHKWVFSGQGPLSPRGFQLPERALLPRRGLGPCSRVGGEGSG